MKLVHAAFAPLVLAVLHGLPGSAPGPGSDPEQLVPLVSEVMRADYRGDVAALGRAAEAFTPFVTDLELGQAALYWRGFAWSCAGLARLMKPPSAPELSLRELELAVGDLTSVSDARWKADALCLASGCLTYVGLLRGAADPEAEARSRRERELLQQALEAGPDNPRVLWIVGGKEISRPAAEGGDPARALATLERGLRLARTAPKEPPHPLAPTWGEPELLSSLAFALAQMDPPDLARAEELAREALALQPEWTYVRELLLPMIQAKARTR
jgi:hypothetical protein